MLSRFVAFIPFCHVSHFRRDCRGRFFDSLKICPGGHGSPVLLRLLIPSPCVAPRSSRFSHSCLKRGRRGRREHSGNAALCCVSTMFPAATAVPFLQNVARRGTLVIYFSVNKFYYVLLRSLTSCHGILDAPWYRVLLGVSRMLQGVLRVGSRSITDVSTFHYGPLRPITFC